MSRRELVDLDDLFAASEAAPTTVASTGGSVRAATRWLLGRAFFSVALGTVIYGVLWVVRVGVPYPLIVGAIFVGTVVRRALIRADVQPLPASFTGQRSRQPARGPGTPDVDAPDGAQIAIGRWESRLRRRGDPDRLTQQLLPRLRELVDERLRLRHGVTMATDPGRARQLMGEALWTMIHHPPRRGFAPHDLSVLVDQMEAL